MFDTDSDSDGKAELNPTNTLSSTRRQTLTFLGGLGGLGLISSQRAAARSNSGSSGPNVDPTTEFSIVTFPDTQYYAEQDNGIFEQMGQWVADNKDEYNIKMFLHEGDLVQNYGTDNEDEWNIAQDAISRMDDENIPAVLTLGNHDADNIRDPETFRSRFPTSRYQEIERTNETILDWGTFEGSPENAYLLQEIHGERFLFITLEFGPRDAVLEWSGQVMHDKSEATAILVTHTYLYHDGTRTDSNDDHAPSNYEGRGLGSDYNNGEQMWQTELHFHANLAIVHSGHHVGGPFVARSKAHAKGNRTSQMFMNYQTIDNGGDGWLRLFTINTDTYDAEINTYSPYLEKWSDDGGESFEFNLRDFTEGS